MEHMAVNPWTWSTERGYHQGEVVSGRTRTLYLSGQAAMDADGIPQFDDMAGQLTLSLDNLEAVLGAAGMTLADLVRLNIFTTDVDALMPHWGLVTGRLAAAGVRPAMTLLGVTRLVVPGLLVELEGTAVTDEEAASS